MPASPSSFIPSALRPAFNKIEQWMRAHESAQRMTTTQRNGLANPAPGLVIFNTTTNQMNYWNGAAWVAW